MRLNALCLQPYGALIDTTVELGDGLTVIHGLNEAGKSTVLAAYADLLCGIRRQTRMDFLVPRARLRICAKITKDDGSEVAVIRTSKNAPNDLLDAATSQPVEEETRRALTTELSHNVLITQFGLDHDRLVVGGRNLTKCDGDLADIVFEARSGIDVRQLVDQLETRCNELFRPRANAASLISRANAHREQLIRGLKETMATAEAVESAAAQLKQAESQLERDRLEEKRRRTDQAQLAQLDESWPYWEQYRTRRGELEQIEVKGTRLSSEHLRTVTAATTRLDEIDEDIQRETSIAETAQRERAGLAFDERLLAAQPAIDSLAKHQPAAEAARAEAITLERQASNERNALANILRRLDLGEPADPVAAFTSIMIPDDKGADLDSLAAQRDRIDDDLPKIQHAVREASEQLRDAESSNTDGRSTTTEEESIQIESVTDSRRHRDLLWVHVRRNWLDGIAVPSEWGSGPTDLASSYEASVIDTDNAADSLAAGAAGHAKIGERRRALERAESLLEQATTALADWEVAWRATTQAAGLPTGIGAPGWRERSALLAEAAQLVESIRGAETGCADCLALAANWDAAASALALELNRSVQQEYLSAWFDGTRTAYDESKANQKAAEIHLANEIQAVERTEVLRAERLTLEEALNAVARAHGVDRGGLDELVERTQLHAEAAAALKEPASQLRARHPAATLEELANEFTSRNREQLAVELRTAEDALELAEDSVTEAQENAIEAKRRLDELTAQTGAEALEQEISQAHAHVVDLVEDFAIYRLMHHLLTQELRSYLEAHQNPVLERAGSFLMRLTSGRYTSLRSEGDGSERSLVIVGSDDSDYSPSALSEGTASQLYLALCLAGVLEVQNERRQAGHERIPIMLDDVLMTFDDERAAYALDLMAEIGEEQQIVLFTHHDAVRQLANSKGKSVTVVGLPAPAPMQ